MKHRIEVSVSDALNVSYTHSSFHQNQCVNHCKHRANYSNWLDNELEGTGSGVDVVTVPGVKDSVQEVIVQDKEEEDEEEEDKEEEEEEEGEEKKYGNQSYLEGDDDKKLPAKMPAFTKKTPKTMDKFKKGKGYVNQHADKQPSVLPIGKTGNDNNDGAPRLYTATESLMQSKKNKKNNMEASIPVEDQPFLDLLDPKHPDFKSYVDELDRKHCGICQSITTMQNIPSQTWPCFR
jgi:hypothetical protein